MASTFPDSTLSTAVLRKTQISQLSLNLIAKKFRNSSYLPPNSADLVESVDVLIPSLNEKFPCLGSFGPDPSDKIDDEGVGKTPAVFSEFPAGVEGRDTPGFERVGPEVSGVGVVGKAETLVIGRLVVTIGSDGSSGNDAAQKQAKLEFALSIHAASSSTQ